jgi:DNA recombination protein RmuC
MSSLSDRHVDQLSEQELSGFVPNGKSRLRIAFSSLLNLLLQLALNEDTTLYNKAFEKNIVIVTPSTLIGYFAHY